MAWFKTGGGGVLSETVLWTNSSPTNTFVAQDVTLSQSIQNFEKIRIYWIGNNTLSAEASIDIPVNDFISNTSGEHLFFMGTKGTSYDYVREAIYKTNTSIGFGVGLRVNASGNAANTVIPTKICGIK